MSRYRWAPLVGLLALEVGCSQGPPEPRARNPQPPAVVTKSKEEKEREAYAFRARLIARRRAQHQPAPDRTVLTAPAIHSGSPRSRSSDKSVSVRGYHRKNGSYVHSYHRSRRH